MNIELQRMVNVIKADVKSFSLIELLDFVAPLLVQLAELTADNRRDDRMIEWSLESKREKRKELSKDIDLLEYQKKEIILSIEKEKANSLQQRDNIVKESNMKLAEVAKKTSELETVKEEKAKQKYFKELARA